MATYATDLNTVHLCDDDTGWSELSGHSSGAAPSQDLESFIHNASAVSQATGQATGTTAGMEYDYGSNISWTSGFAFFVWQMFAAPTNIYDWANGGMRFGVGSSSGNMDFWNALGDNFGNYPYGGWQNTAIDPEVTADTTDGTPTGTYRYFGSLPNMRNKITKGSPHVIDAIRYGRGEFQVTGTGADFSGMAAANDASTARWGLFRATRGGFLWKGLMSLGLTGTSVTFSDSNKNIFIEDTPRVSSGFNKIEINNASSSITWNNITILGIQTSITGSDPVSPGDFEVVDDATVDLTSCTFVDMGIFAFDSNSTLDVCTWRRCHQVTGNEAIFDRCDFDSSPAAIAISVSDLNQVTNGHFISDGNGHAVELTSLGTGTMTWSNVVVGYASSDGSTGDEALYVNVGSGTLNLSIATGATTPSIRTAGATVNIVSSVDLTMTVKDESGSVIVGAYAYIDDNDQTPFIMNTTTNSSGIATTPYSGSPVTGARWRVRKYGYKPFKQIIDIGSSDISIPVTLITDPQQT